MISESHPNGLSARTLLSDDLSLAQRRGEDLGMWLGPTRGYILIMKNWNDLWTLNYFIFRLLSQLWIILREEWGQVTRAASGGMCVVTICREINLSSTKYPGLEKIIKIFLSVDMKETNTGTHLGDNSSSYLNFIYLNKHKCGVSSLARQLRCRPICRVNHL